MDVAPFSGIVLAAGRSTRMGRDKALLDVAGQPQWQRQRDVLTGAGVREIFLSVRPDQTWAAGVRGFAAIVHDALPECGPLVGITAGLERSSAPWLAVLAIDLPAMRSEWFQRLREHLAEGRGVVGRRAGYFEPLAAIYPTAMKWLAWEALAKNEYALQKWIAVGVAQGLMHVHEIDATETEWFENWNQGVERSPEF